MLCILGRTGSGKSTLVKHLKGFDPVVSYCDRCKRSDETEGVEHYFISPEEFTKLMNENEICAYSEIKGVRYMALKSQVHENSVYVIDPAGLEDLKDVSTFNVYVWADEDTRRKRTEGRNFDFDSREQSEDSMFTDYENMGKIDLWVSSMHDSPEALAEVVMANYMK